MNKTCEITTDTLLIKTLCNYDYLLQNRRKHSKKSYNRHLKKKNADELWWIYIRCIRNTNFLITLKLTFLNFLSTIKLRCSYVIIFLQLIKNSIFSRQQHKFFIIERLLWSKSSERFWSYLNHYCSLLLRNLINFCFVQSSRIKFKLFIKLIIIVVSVVFKNIIIAALTFLIISLINFWNFLLSEQFITFHWLLF